MLGRAYRKCGESGSLTFQFFWEPGTGAGLFFFPAFRKCGRVDRTFLFGVSEPGREKNVEGPKKFEQVLGRAYRKCGGSTALFFFFGSEPGTGAENVEREGLGIAELQLIDGNEGLAGFFFLCFRRARRKKRPKKFEQVLGRAYRKCGGWTALFFFFLVSEPGTGARPSLQKMWRVGIADFSSFFFFLGRSEPGTGAWPSLQKMWRVDRTFLFFWWSEPSNRC